MVLGLMINSAKSDRRAPGRDIALQLASDSAPRGQDSPQPRGVDTRMGAGAWRTDSVFECLHGGPVWKAGQAFF